MSSEGAYELFRKGSELLEAGDFMAAQVPLERARSLEPDKSSIREALDDKIVKSGRDGLALELEPTEDVLSVLAKERNAGQTLIGFAAEHGKGAVERGRAKLERKGLDAIVVNDISRADIGFDAPDNEVTIVTAARERQVQLGSKRAVAAAILDEVEVLRSPAGAAGTLEG